MFINISNHPSGHWQEEQLDMARQWGKVMDYPFPAVEPQASVAEILEIAEGVVKDVLSLTNNSASGNVLHIMGEMTLCYALVYRFHQLGYRCVASTTDRHAVSLEDGSKYSRFEFVQFRDYYKF